MEEKKLQDCLLPDPALVHPIEGLRELIYVKPTIKNPNISVGDFTYFGDEDFEKHVTHFYPFYGDKLIIGKFSDCGGGEFRDERGKSSDERRVYIPVLYFRRVEAKHTAA